jgi:hypothetical protein
MVRYENSIDSGVPEAGFAGVLAAGHAYVKESSSASRHTVSSMSTLPFLLPHVASAFERYLTLQRAHPTRTYSYAARGFSNLPVIDVSQHGPKCRQGESWMYVAIPEGASIHSLAADERLYVGAQTQDRMFRGDECDGANYHHAEMRAGNGNDNPVAYLQSGRRVEIHRLSADAIRSRVEKVLELQQLVPLLRQPRTPRRHLAWWFEQYVLYREPKQWRWNSAGADKAVAEVLLGRGDT